MAGRKNTAKSGPGQRLHHHHHHHHPYEGSRPLPPPDRFPPLPEVHLMEERIATQRHEIETLIVDNQRLAATHVALKQDVTAVQQEVRHLSAAFASVKAEKDAQVREVYERYRNLEAEAQSVQGLAAELDRVRREVEERKAERKELSEKMKEIGGEVTKTKSELAQVTEIKAEMEKVQQEIQRGRLAIEHEKRMQVRNSKISEVMEKHLIAMTQEVEILCSELAKAEKKPMVVASTVIPAANPGPGYAIYQGNLELAYGGNSLSDHQV